MFRQRYYYEYNHLHFLTASTYHRTQLFASDRFQRRFTQTWNDLRAELGFRLLGYVLMPEHYHLLMWPREFRITSRRAG